MKYPKWNSYCTTKRKNDALVEITNYLLEESYCLPIEIVSWGRKLDGTTNPRSIDKTLNEAAVRDRLELLSDFDCIRTTRVLLKTTGNFLYSIYIPHRITRAMRMFAWFYNKALQISFLPMLVFGIYYFHTHFNYGNGGICTGLTLGTILGLFLHEISHACAALACPGGKFFEVGIGILKFMPVGYALIDTKQVKSRFQRIQVNLAGIETNLFLCGLFFFLSSFGGDFFGEAFFGAAIQNGFLGFVNLVFNNGIDGANVICELLGDNTVSFISKTRGLIWSKRKRQKILNAGLSGYAIIASACIFQLLQLTVPALLVWNVLCILEVI